MVRVGPQGGKPFHFYSTDGEGVFRQVTSPDLCHCSSVPDYVHAGFDMTSGGMRAGASYI